MQRDEERTVFFRLLALVLALIVGAWLLGLNQSGPKSPTQGAGGNYGYDPNPEGTRRFLSELEQPMFAQAGEECIRKAQGKDTFLWRAGANVHKELYGTDWVVVRQGIGDCVSHGWAHGCWMSACVAYELGELSEPPPMVASESVYGLSRVEARGRTTGSWSDGSYGGAAAKAVRDWGVAFRIKYSAADGGHDLTQYDAGRAKQWGFYGNGGEGDSGKFDAVCKRHPMRHVALVKNFQEAAAAIESGYCVPVCSGYGFSSQRDEQGFARRQGSWSHCMVLCAVRYGDRPGCCCLNSWGPRWNGGPKWPDDQPDGSFWIDAETVTGMLSGGDSFAVGSIEGFKWRDLHHGDWLMPAPALGEERK